MTPIQTKPIIIDKLQAAKEKVEKMKITDKETI